MADGMFLLLEIPVDPLQTSDLPKPSFHSVLGESALYYIHTLSLCTSHCINGPDVYYLGRFLLFGLAVLGMAIDVLRLNRLKVTFKRKLCLKGDFLFKILSILILYSQCLSRTEQTTGVG